MALASVVCQHAGASLVAKGLGISWNMGNDAALAVGRNALTQGPHRSGGVRLIGAAVSSNPSVETAAANPLRSMPRSAPFTPAPGRSSRSGKSVPRPFSLSRSMSRSRRPRTPPWTFLPDPHPQELHRRPVARSRWINTPTTPSIAASPYCLAPHHDASFLSTPVGLWRRHQPYPRFTGLRKIIFPRKSLRSNGITGCIRSLRCGAPTTTLPLRSDTSLGSYRQSLIQCGAGYACHLKKNRAAQIQSLDILDPSVQLFSEARHHC